LVSRAAAWDVRAAGRIFPPGGYPVRYGFVISEPFSRMSPDDAPTM